MVYYNAFVVYYCMLITDSLKSWGFNFTRLYHELGLVCEEER